MSGLRGTAQKQLDADISQMTDAELARYLGQLSPKARAALNQRIDQRMDTERRIWYCGDRRCDGEPHGIYNYKHARGSKRDDSRGSQYPPPGVDWVTWLMLAGRGSGKTKTGAEYTRYISKKVPSLALIGPTGPGLRNVMIEGRTSGLIRACRDAGEEYHYEPSKQRFTFQSGAVATLYTAEEPERIRGANLGFVWADEPAFWADPQAVWDIMMFALREEPRPHVLATTTPLPTDFIKQLVASPSTRTVTGSTYDNRSNLAPTYFQQILDKYEGTYLGRQEIYGEIIDDRVGALWKSPQFQIPDFYFDPTMVEMDRVLVGIDPAGSNNKRSDLTGIVVGGIRGDILHAIDDLSGKFSPAGWARAAINAHDKYKADAIVVERNYGGDMCRATLRAEGFEGRILEAKATDGKRVRAEPIAARYEQGKARHVRGGAVGKLESEMVSWVPGEGKSPNRVDAWVWVSTALTAGSAKATTSTAEQMGTHLGSTQYRGPGSPYSKKQARRGKWLSR